MGQKYEITNNNIISLETIVKLNYKDCQIIFKRTDQVYIIDAIIITREGYIIEFSQTFLAKKETYPNLLNYLNNVIDKDLDIVYQKLMNKKKFIKKMRNN